MVAALKPRFSVEKYFRMGETAILKPKVRGERIDGEMVDMMPIGLFDSGSVYWLSSMFNKRANGRWIVGS